MNSRYKTVAVATALGLVLTLGWAYQRSKDTATAAPPAWSTSLSRLGIRLSTYAQCPPDMPGCSATPQRRKRAFLNGRYGKARASIYYGHRLKRIILHKARVAFHHRNLDFHRKSLWREFNRHDTCIRSSAYASIDQLCKQRDQLDYNRAGLEVRQILVCGTAIIPLFLKRGMGGQVKGKGSRLISALPGAKQCAWFKTDKKYRNYRFN